MVVISPPQFFKRFFGNKFFCNTKEDTMVSHMSIVNPVEVKMKESARGSLYEAIVAMGLRARQVNDQIKIQLQGKMADVMTDGDESEGTNFDQLAISREFDMIPKPTFIAMKEMFEDKIEHHILEIKKD